MKVFTLFLSLFLTGCTINLANISTHGVASDLIDDTTSTDPEVAPDITIQ